MAYGFKPVKMAGSRYDTGGFTEVPIENDTPSLILRLHPVLAPTIRPPTLQNRWAFSLAHGG